MLEGVYLFKVQRDWIVRSLSQVTLHSCYSGQYSPVVSFIPARTLCSLSWQIFRSVIIDKSPSYKHPAQTLVSRGLRSNLKVPRLIRQKKICVFTVRRPSLIFDPDPKLFYDPFSRKFVKYPIFAFQCSFCCLMDHNFDKKTSYSSSVEMHYRCHPTSIQ